MNGTYKNGRGSGLPKCEAGNLRRSRHYFRSQTGHASCHAFPKTCYLLPVAWIKMGMAQTFLPNYEDDNLRWSLMK